MTRFYEATWDQSYVREGTRTVSESHFHADNGYGIDDLQRITALEVEEQAELDGSHHFVKRIR
jgi:cystathionine beta-lyase family protein involved in aluminum resistance